MFVRLLLCAFVVTLSTASFASSKLFLVGGSWKTCGSFSTSSCDGKVDWPEDAKTENTYAITKDKLTKLKALAAWQPGEEPIRGALLNVLSNFHNIHQSTAFGKRDFQRQLDKIAINIAGTNTTGKKLLNALPDHLYYPVNDILETAGVDAAGQYKKERASVNDSKYQGSKAIYAAFIKAVRAVTPENQKPIILVSTASGYDVFGAADYYLSIFSDLGADARWLPLEATFGKLQDEGGCSNINQARPEYVNVYNRETVYPYLTEYQQAFCDNPEKVTELAAKANGIFFNGGDQSLTWQAFVNKNDADRPWLAALRNQFKQGKLVISGTSAGTAVQSGVPGANTAGMITGGTSDGALIMGAEDKMPWIERVDPEANIRPVTYHSKGGLKFFPYGILDTHFSERGRQLRLAKLVLESDATFGFGVDETTALVATPIDANNAEFEVVGQNGVYVIEQNDKSINSAQRIRYTSHYLVNGQRFSLKDGKLVFPPEEFNAFKKLKGSHSIDEDLTQKTVFRDMLEEQLDDQHETSVATFTNNEHRFEVMVTLSKEDSQISTRKSMDKLSGYINAIVTATAKAPQ